MRASARRQNPWLTISSEDYEAHMGHPRVRQLQFLNGLFHDLIREFRPKTLAVVGCTSGNGFEHIRSETTERVIGIDINPSYLDQARRRFSDRIENLVLICSDVRTCSLPSNSLDFVHCALLLEYVSPVIVLEKAADWLHPGGILAVVLQLPSPELEKVTETGVRSLLRLEEVMELVDVGDLERLAEESGFVPVKSSKAFLESGKGFFTGVYRLQE